MRNSCGSVGGPFLTEPGESIIRKQVVVKSFRGTLVYSLKKTLLLFCRGKEKKFEDPPVTTSLLQSKWNFFYWMGNFESSHSQQEKS